jgi:RNA polymerase sigma factor (sigma-70 family)
VTLVASPPSLEADQTAGTAPDPFATEQTSELTTEDFADLFRIHYPRLLRALTFAGADLMTAEDISQEAFARTLARWRRVRKGTNPPGYVFRVAFRLLHRRGLLPMSSLDDDIPTPGLEDAVIAKVDAERCLAAMPPRRRACVILCWLLDLPPADAAEALGIAAGTVRKQLELARAQMN